VTSRRSLTSALARYAYHDPIEMTEEQT
jgi:hypothetical protein